MILLQIKLMFNQRINYKLFHHAHIQIDSQFRRYVVLVLQKLLGSAAFFIPSPTRMAGQQKAVGKNEYEWYDEKLRQLEFAVLNLQLELTVWVVMSTICHSYLQPLCVAYFKNSGNFLYGLFTCRMKTKPRK